jgi:two-component system cell cycle sensor histidine kinase/response regulator CckA
MSKLTYEELTEKVQNLEAVEARLRESEEKFRLAFHTNPDAINLNRVTDGLYLDINEGFSQSMGYTREEVLGKTSLDLNIWVDPEDRERLISDLKKAGYVDNLEAQFRRKNGEIGTGLMSARVLRINQENVILSITHDITERKKIEQSLMVSEYRYRTLFEKTNDAIYVIEKRTGRFLDANEAALKMTGRTLSELCQLTTHDVAPGGSESRLAAVEHTNEAMNLGRVTYVRPDGTERIALLSTAPLDENRAFGIARDITSEVRLEEKYQQSQKMEAIGQLAGGIAHDFNNLLVPILGYAELGMNNTAESDQLQIYFERVYKAAGQAANLTKQILAFSRRQVLALQTLDLNKIIRDFQELAERILREDIDMQIYLASSLGKVQADRAQIEQILMNLLVNARDAMPGNGKLIIETANILLDEAYFEIYGEEKKPGHYVMVAVSDTGQGMDEETQKHIFEPFFTTKERGKGTGLGLATVFGIVEQHQGHIWVYSKPGKGTTFKIYLPQSEVTTQPAEFPQVEVDSVHGTETILVVEDAEMVRKLICETLTAYGYNVIEASKPSQAIERAYRHHEKLHLLLTDVIMPQMSGRDLHDKMIAIKPDLKTLYISGYTDDIIVHHGILDKKVNFLQKPFTTKSLTNKVREVLDE